ncbi:MAG: glycosyltransferase family 9 protein [Brumimicrobium sp.]
MKFLIIQTAFIGDVILMTPIISELKRIYPDSAIDVVVRKGNEVLLTNNPKINKIIIWNKRQQKYKSLLKTISQIRQKEYDEIITLQRYANAGFMTMFGKAKKKIGFDKNKFSWVYDIKIRHSLTSGKHEVERNLELIQHHNCKKLIRPELFPSKDDFEFVKQFQSETYFCVAPSSVVPSKQLPAEKWLELFEILSKKGQILLIGAHNDYDLCESLKEKFPQQIQNLAGKTSLLQSAALMKDAAMNFTNDSSPLHIASSMNAPVRAFFTGTIPLYGFGPLSDDSKVIEPNPKLNQSLTTPTGIKSPIDGLYNMGSKIEISPENLSI